MPFSVSKNSARIWIPKNPVAPVNKTLFIDLGLISFGILIFVFKILEYFLVKLLKSWLDNSSLLESIFSASSDIVGYVKISEYFILFVNFSNLIFKFIAKMESPPNSKKLSFIPIGLVFNISSQIVTNLFCKSVCGLTYSEISAFCILSGIGRAFLSILPFGV